MTLRLPLRAIYEDIIDAEGHCICKFGNGTSITYADSQSLAAEIVERVNRTIPLALRDDQITEADVDTMLRVANDPNAPSGRYKRFK